MTMNAPGRLKLDVSTAPAISPMAPPARTGSPSRVTVANVRCSSAVRASSINVMPTPFV